jgi:hypothetical protein
VTRAPAGSEVTRTTLPPAGSRVPSHMPPPAASAPSTNAPSVSPAPPPRDRPWGTVSRPPDGGSARRRSIWASAAAIACIDAKRAEGSLDSARTITASTSADSAGTRVRGGTGALWIC